MAGQRAGRDLGLRLAGSLRILAALLLAGCAGETGVPDGQAGDPDAASRSDETATRSPGVEIEYIAHASFLLRAEDGTELLIDPYASRVWLGYDWPDGIESDVVLITHPHYDHDAGRYRELPFPWSDQVVVVDAPGSFTFGDFHVTGVRGKHADPYGMEFGQLNTIMVVEVAGLRIAHLGDNGPLTPEMAARLGRVDILMMPADAEYHILSEETTQAILEAVQPSIVIPMHYRLGDLETKADAPSDLGDIDPWLELRPGVQRLDGHVTTLRASELPAERTYLVFEHAPYVSGPRG